MNTQQVLEELKKLGNAGTKNIFLKHGAKEPVYGVKVEDLKKIQKKAKNDHQLALELFDTGVSDAMYLAGLMADGSKMTKKQLQQWAGKASWYMVSEYSVAWVTSENEKGWDIATEWIESPEEHMASAGWSTLSAIISVRPNDQLDLPAIKRLLQTVEKNIADAKNRVRYTMNAFVLGVGASIPELTRLAIATAKRIGVVTVDMGGTACKVPYAPDYIEKIKQKGYIGKKRKTAKC